MNPTADASSVNVQTPPPVAKPNNAPGTPDPESLPLTIIDGRAHWTFGDLKEIWRFREVFWQLTLRDIKLRYKQTILGLGWSFFQPLTTILVFVVFIGILGKAAEGVDKWQYVLFVVAGVLPWTFFNSAVLNGGNSFVNNEQLVSKVYFPRLALPMSNIFAAIFDWVICLVAFALVMLCVGEEPSWRIVFAPMVMFMLVVLASGFAILLSALIAEQRDFRYLLQFGMQIWMFATPGIYLRAETIPEGARLWILLNPVQGLVTNFRSCLLGPERGGELDFLGFAVASVITVAVFVLGLLYFRRVDRTLADKI